MPSSPFTAAGLGAPLFDPAQWERAARMWTGTPAAPQPAPFDPFGWWKGPGAASDALPPSMDPTVLAGQWLGMIQQLAAQFGGRDAAPADIVSAWRSMLGDNPFAIPQAASAFMPPSFAKMPMGTAAAFDLPSFGFMREHQERGQAFARTMAEFQQASQVFQSIIGETGQEAFARFESLLSRRAAEGKPVESGRALFDLWIDAAEDAYADIALGERFQKAFGDYVNAQMRVRAAMQAEVERACGQWGIPGRVEVDAAHRRIADLQREVSRLRRTMEESRPKVPPRAQTRTAANTTPGEAPKKTRAVKRAAAKRVEKR